MASLVEVVLNPGDFHFAGEETRIRTLLGSCVSITLWHPRLRIGGMCHYMLPSRGQRRGGSQPNGRYADEAMQLFLRELVRHSTQPQQYEARMFGGGNQFPDKAIGSCHGVCRDNVEQGLRLLHQYGFALASQHLGGTGFRRVTFDVSTGRVGLAHVEWSAVNGAARVPRPARPKTGGSA